MSSNPENSPTAEPAQPSTGQRGFSIFIELEQRIRQADCEAELLFLMVNETHALARYRQALLWRDDPDRSGGRIAAVSGLTAPDPNAPFIAWMERVFKHFSSQPPGGVTPFDSTTLSADLAAEWGEWLPAYALWIPLAAKGGKSRLGALVLARDSAWTDGERHLLTYLADAYSHAWDALRGARRKSWWSPSLPGKKKALFMAATIVAIGLMPVRQSALAPAEVIAQDPVVVRAPIDGVIDRFAVTPNHPVNEGDPLFFLDSTRLSSRLEVARKDQQVAEVEYRQAAQQAVYDSRAKATLQLLKGKAEQHASEVAYIRSLLERIVVRAPRSGVAIFGDVNDWIGRPVVIGERVVMVADPAKAEVEIHLPVSDAVALEAGSPVRLFLNVDPQSPVGATLYYASYQAAQTPEGVFAYRLVASLNKGERPLRIGLKGTAKVYGSRTLLAIHLLRRPLATLRRYLTL